MVKPSKYIDDGPMTGTGLPELPNGNGFKVDKHTVSALIGLPVAQSRKGVNKYRGSSCSLCRHDATLAFNPEDAQQDDNHDLRTIYYECRCSNSCVKIFALKVCMHNYSVKHCEEEVHLPNFDSVVVSIVYSQASFAFACV